MSKEMLLTIGLVLLLGVVALTYYLSKTFLFMVFGIIVVVSLVFWLVKIIGDL